MQSYQLGNGALGGDLHAIGAELELGHLGGLVDALQDVPPEVRVLELVVAHGAVRLDLLGVLELRRPLSSTPLPTSTFS